MNQGIDYAQLGSKIKEARISKGLTQDILAEMVNCNTSHISNIENSHTKVSLNILLSIANALDTTIDLLLFDQYSNGNIAVDSEINRYISKCDLETKHQILRIIKAL